MTDMTISRAAMDALQKTLDEGTSIQKIWSILDSCTVVEPPAASAEAQGEFKGWYCAHCECGVDGRNVTFSEQHDACGRYIANDRPPKALSSTPALREVTDAIDIFSLAEKCGAQFENEEPSSMNSPGTPATLLFTDRQLDEFANALRARLSTAQPDPFLQNAPDTDDIEQASAWVSSNCFDPEIEQTLHHALNRAQTSEAAK